MQLLQQGVQSSATSTGTHGPNIEDSEVSRLPPQCVLVVLSYPRQCCALSTISPNYSRDLPKAGLIGLSKIPTVGIPRKGNLRGQDQKLGWSSLMRFL